MAGSSTDDSVFILSIKHFPPVINGRINAKEFVAAVADLIRLLECFGVVFIPVRVDLQGNVRKIKKYYKYDDNSCLLELMLEEKSKGDPIAAEGCLWLNRALLYFEMLFLEMKNNFQANQDIEKIDMQRIFIDTYHKSISQYHNWVGQIWFSFLWKMSPNMHQLLKSLKINDNNFNEFISTLDSHNLSMHKVRCKIDDFFLTTNILHDYAPEKYNM